VLDTAGMKLLRATSSIALVGLAACAATEPPSYPRETRTPALVSAPPVFVAAPPPPPPPKTFSANSDNVPELFDCLGAQVCGTLEQRARRRAAAAFKCPADQIETKERSTHDLSVKGSLMVWNPLGHAEFHVAPKPGKAFYVRGCEQRGLLACVSVNRSVRTADKTYENTDDRICLWADWVDE
jgi:hypothetical protein